MLELHNRIPTVQEAVNAIQQPLRVSYWWLNGLQYNCPVIAEVVVSVHVIDGPKVRVFFGEYSKQGLTEDFFSGRTFTMIGPIPLPDKLKHYHA